MTTKTHFDIIEHEVDLCVVGGGVAGLSPPWPRHATAPGDPDPGSPGAGRQRLVRGPHVDLRRARAGQQRDGHPRRDHARELLPQPDPQLPDLGYGALRKGALPARPDDCCSSARATTCRWTATASPASTAGSSTTQTWHIVKARYFADCSGDSVLRISGAEFRCGRESRDEFDESHAPEVADGKTMGNSILIQLRESPKASTGLHRRRRGRIKYDDERPAQPPAQARRPQLLVAGDRRHGRHHRRYRGESATNCSRSATACGTTSRITPMAAADNWELDWIGSLPGKRENVRYVGDHILTQNDIAGRRPLRRHRRLRRLADGRPPPRRRSTIRASRPSSTRRRRPTASPIARSTRATSATCSSRAATSRPRTWRSSSTRVMGTTRAAGAGGWARRRRWPSGTGARRAASTSITSASCKRR